MNWLKIINYLLLCLIGLSSTIAGLIAVNKNMIPLSISSFTFTLLLMILLELKEINSKMPEKK